MENLVIQSDHNFFNIFFRSFLWEKKNSYFLTSNNKICFEWTKSTYFMIFIKSKNHVTLESYFLDNFIQLLN